MEIGESGIVESVNRRNGIFESGNRRKWKNSLYSYAINNYFCIYEVFIIFKCMKFLLFSKSFIKLFIGLVLFFFTASVIHILKAFFQNSVFQRRGGWVLVWLRDTQG